MGRAVSDISNSSRKAHSSDYSLGNTYTYPDIVGESLNFSGYICHREHASVVISYVPPPYS